MSNQQVVVVGGGLAGLSCAVELVEGGAGVELFEAKPQLGGRTSSWQDNGMAVESGLHRYLGFYSHLPELLKKAGIDERDVVVWEDEIEVRTPAGTQAVFGVSPLHKPFKTLQNVLANAKLIDVADNLALAKFFAAGLKDLALRPEILDRASVAQMARQYNISDQAMTAILEPLTTGMFFLPPDRYSAYVLFQTLNLVLTGLPSMRVGAFAGGMTEVMAKPLGDWINLTGGNVHTGTPVAELMVANGGVTGVRLESGQEVAGHVVVATPLAQAQKLLRPFAGQEFFAKMMQLKSMPVLTVQLELSEPATPADRVIFGAGTILASFAEQSRTTFQHSKGRLSVIIAEPDRFTGLGQQALVDLVVADAAKLGFDLAGKVKNSRVIYLKDDFHSLAPGQNSLRPPQQTPIAGLILAGDYTQQQYLGTMEGAVYSGKLAADIIAPISQ